MNKQLFFCLLAVVSLFLLAVEAQNASTGMHLLKENIPLAESEEHSVAVKSILSQNSHGLAMKIDVVDSNENLVRGIVLGYKKEKNGQIWLTAVAEKTRLFDATGTEDGWRISSDSFLSEEEALSLIPKLQKFMENFSKKVESLEAFYAPEELGEELVKDISYVGWLSKEHWKMFVDNVE